MQLNLLRALTAAAAAALARAVMRGVVAPLLNAGARLTARPVPEHNGGERSVDAAGWYPLPGNWLELRDTGFAIHFVARKGRPPFYLYDPEGDPIAWSGNLPGLKQHAEAQARMRDEFRPVHVLHSATRRPNA